MANTVNYAEKWRPDLIPVRLQQMITSPFVSDFFDFLGTKTIHFTQQSVSGFKAGNRLLAGVQRGDVTQNDNTYALDHEREIEFGLHAYDINESNGSFAVGGVTDTFQMTQVAPEHDSLFFSTVATEAEGLGATNFVADAISGFDKTNVYGKVKALLKLSKLRRYRARGTLIMYIDSVVMDLLEQSDELTRKIELTQVMDGGLGVETRITSIDGVPILEVIDTERFYTGFDYTDGFVPAVGAFKLNMLVASTETVKTTIWDESIFQFAPGTHTQGNGFLIQYNQLSGVHILPNGSDNVIDSIAISRDTVAVV